MTINVYDFGHRLVRSYKNVQENEARSIEVHEQMNGYKTERR